MKFSWFSIWPSSAAAAAVLCALPGLASAETFSAQCDKGGDQLGFAIATNGDFNGDGVNDIAIGSPCMLVRTHPHAGRVIIVDGRGNLGGGRRVLFNKRGAQENQWYGAAVSFVPDINGDGRDEIAVGSPGYDVTGVDLGDPQLGTRDRAGRVDVYQRRRRRLRVFGLNTRAGFGEKIAPISDVNEDNKPDFVVSATGDRNANGDGQPGRVWVVSGKNGDLLSYRIGPKQGNNYGRSLATAEDFDDDGIVDFLAGSDEANVPGVLRAGIVDLLSSADPAGEPLFEVVGANKDRLGKAVDFAGDTNDDDIPEAIIGSEGSDDTGITKAGLVWLYSLDGTPLWVKPDEGHIQDNARFGDALARIGDIDGDGITDFGASAALYDVIDDKTAKKDAGRVVTLSGATGNRIWSVDGNRKFEEMGFALDGDIDFNLDEVPDLVVGTIGDDPFGRRGAGSVRILSGVDGSRLYQVAGRRGLETRIVAVVPDESGGARAKSFSRTGRRTEMNVEVLADVSIGELDVSILNDMPFDFQFDPHVPRPRSVQVAVTGGAGANDSTVEVWRLGRHANLIQSFEAFPGDSFSVECGAGEVNGRVNEDLVCTRADGAGGNVFARIYERLDEHSSFFLQAEFQVFSEDDMLNELTPIDADGANVAVGNVVGDKNQEIIVGTTRGVPLVKIFQRDGTFVRSFLAYDPVGYSGVDVELVDLDGSGDQWIVTAPREGEALIKVFDGNGNRVSWGNEDNLISILARGAPWTFGARVGAADVDLDDQQEILIYLPADESEEDGGEAVVLAYEPTNQKVRHYDPFNPLTQARTGGAIAGTDRWVRN